jgi:hypothetical protein
VDSQTQKELFDAQGNKPIPGSYKNNPRAVASVVFLWVGFVATVGSTYILFASYKHNAQYGPKTAHLRREEESNAEKGMAVPDNQRYSNNTVVEEPMQPEVAHTHV